MILLLVSISVSVTPRALSVSTCVVARRLLNCAALPLSADYVVVFLANASDLPFTLARSIVRS